MKNIFLLLTLTLSSVCMAQKGAEITFDKKGLQFDSIPEGTQLKVVYTFTNTGDAELSITKVKATCGCTVVSYSKKPIAPGQTDSINAVFDTNLRAGHNAKGINLETNAGPVSLVFQVFVIPNENTPAMEPAESLEEEDHSGHNH